MMYVQPHSLDEACRHLSRDPDARCIAGGMSLVAMMNAGLVTPSTLIGLQGIPGLMGIHRRPDHIRIGALTTHTTLAQDACLAGAANVIRVAASQIAHAAVRNSGTIGGSIAHGDPAADLPTALVAADAAVEIYSVVGLRVVNAADFFKGYLETALEPGEIVTAVLIPPFAPEARGQYLKFARTDGDYATLSVGLVLVECDGRCVQARVAIGAAASTPLHLSDADDALRHNSASPEGVAEAARILAAASDPISDVRGSAEYRRRLIFPLVARAVASMRKAVHD